MNRNDAIAVLAHLDAVRILVEPFASEPPVRIDPLSPAAVFVVPDVLLLPSERVARVRVQLVEPVQRQLRATFATSNGTALKGSAATKWASYAGVTADLIFRPGETEKVVEVPIHRDLGAATFSVSINHSVNNPPVAPASGTVRQVAVRDPVVYRPQPVFAPIDPIAGRSLTYSTDFLDLTWDKRGGFWQQGNKEAALYCDVAMQPGFEPHPVEQVEGEPRRILRMIRQDVQATIGSNRITLPYRAAMLNSSKAYLCRHGDYIELDAIVAPNTGGVPAFWLIGGGPYAEIDIEFGLGGYPGLAATIHYADGAGGIPMEGVRTTHVPDGKRHRYGIYRGDDWLATFVDGVEVHRRPAIFQDRELAVVINNTTGGILRADPKWPVGQTEDIVLFGFRAYR